MFLEDVLDCGWKYGGKAGANEGGDMVGVMGGM